jgi:outer membrane protein assembly factor BamB
MRRFSPLLILPMALFALPSRGEDNWPQFRGRQGGLAEGTNLPVTWNTSKNVAWKTEIPGRGWSSPIVWGDKIFLTAVVSDAKTPPPTKGYTGDFQGKTPPGIHQWVVYCLNFKDGKILWQRIAHKGKPVSTIHGKNTYASETAVTDGKRVYAYFGNIGLFCYDFSGKPLWSRSFGVYKTKMGWGTGASPVLHKDRIYIVNDNEDKSFLVAVDAKTGDEVWRIPRDEKSNWSTPFIWENEKRTEIVTTGSAKVRSYSLDGKLLWELTGMSSLTIPTPSSRHGLLYLSSGFTLDFQRRPILAVRPGASGDITLKQGETKNKYIAWAQPYAAPYHPSPLVYGDFLYVLHDRGFMACYEAKTGKQVYKKQRIPGNNHFTASPWAYDGKIFCLSEDGVTFVIQAGREFKVLGKNRLEDMALATPAVAGDSVIIRTVSRLYRLRREKPSKGN